MGCRDVRGSMLGAWQATEEPGKSTAMGGREERSREQPEGREDRARQSHSEGEVVRGPAGQRLRW